MESNSASPIRNDYVRLAGTTHDRSTNVPRYYMGPNHLLILKRNSASEAARRFYYKDITALRCRPTRWGYYLDGTFVAVAVLLWLNYLITPGTGSAVAAVTVGIMAGIALLTNWLRGPTCETWLHTANHTERLSSLGRYNTARRALGKLHDRIVEAQAERFGDDVAVTRPFEPYTHPAETPENATLRRHDARVMQCAFFVALVSVVLGYLDFFIDYEGKNALGLWTAVASVLLSVAAIVRSYNTDCPALARRMCACLVASTTLSIPITMAAIIFLAMNGVRADDLPSIRDLQSSDGLQYIVIVGIHLAMVLFDTICAVTGLIALYRNPTS